MTLQEAKEQIAKDNGWDHWESINRSKHAEGILWEMAATLYAHSKWDEAAALTSQNIIRQTHLLSFDLPDLPEFKP